MRNDTATLVNECGHPTFGDSLSLILVNNTIYDWIESTCTIAVLYNDTIINRVYLIPMLFGDILCYTILSVRMVDINCRRRATWQNSSCMTFLPIRSTLSVVDSGRTVLVFHNHVFFCLVNNRTLRHSNVNSPLRGFRVWHFLRRTVKRVSGLLLTISRHNLTWHRVDKFGLMNRITKKVCHTCIC